MDRVWDAKQANMDQTAALRIVRDCTLDMMQVGTEEEDDEECM